MPTLGPTKLKAQVRKWRQRSGWEAERLFAVSTDLEYQGDREIEVGDLVLSVVECRSDLEAREQMLTHGSGGERGMVMLVRANHDAIGEDVRCYLAGRQLLSLDPREVLRDVFKATAVDARISANSVLLEALIDKGGELGMRPAPGGMLDLDFAWGILLGRPELANQRPDLVELLRWSIDSERWAAVQFLNPELRLAFFEWAAERAGSVAACLAHLTEAEKVDQFLPLGFVAGDLFASVLDDNTDATGGRYRFESVIGDRRINAREAAAWKAAAVSAFSNLPLERIERVVAEVDGILKALSCEGIATYFSHSKMGYSGRWREFADALDKLPKRKWDTGGAALNAALVSVSSHVLARTQRERLDRAAMAARLGAFEQLQKDDDVAAKDLNAAAVDYLKGDSFIDWARFTLAAGDPDEMVNKCYGRIAQRAAKRRIGRQMEFGKILSDWCGHNGHLSQKVNTIERVSERFVAPIAAEAPVLLVVLDGMNAPVFHQIARDMSNNGWLPFDYEGKGAPSPVISALPSITTVSRWGLLAGKLEHGKRTGEPVAFREQETLYKVSSKGKPKLFAKGDLLDGAKAGLSDEVRDVLIGSEHKVAGVIVNAIDDQLSTNGQLNVTWSVTSIGILPSILAAAAEGERVIILVSDHGHVPELGSSKLEKHDGVKEARWRPGDTAGEGEMVFSGERIEQASGYESIVMPVVENLRYTAISGGYHGGATDLEAVIPLCVFAQSENMAKGLVPVDLAAPEWWNWQEEFSAGGIGRMPKPAPKAKPKAKKIEEELPLFAGLDLSGKEDVPWLDAFFASEIYQAELKRLGRNAPKQEHVSSVLSALEAGNGTLLIPVLAKMIKEPEIRLSGLLSRVCRLLNIEGYAVLSVDRESATVRLNKPLLAKQFDLKI